MKGSRARLMVSLTTAVIASAYSTLSVDGACKGNPDGPYYIFSGNVDQYCSAVCEQDFCPSVLCICDDSQSSDSGSSSSTTIAPTTAVTKTIDPTPPTLIGYWQNLADATPFSKIPDYYGIVILAFSTLENGIPTKIITPALAKAIKQRQTKGGKVFLGLGGDTNCGPNQEGDNMYGAAATGKEEESAKAVADIVKTYSLDGVDIDYECYDVVGGKRVQNNANVVAYAKALRKALPSSAQLSWAAFSDAFLDNPSYVDHSSTFNDAMATKAFDYFWWMSYNYLDRSFYTDIPKNFAKLISKSGLSEKQAAVGLCVSGNACAAKGTVDGSDLSKDFDTYLAAAANGAGLMVWDINRDYIDNGKKDWNNTISAQAAKRLGKV